MATSWTDSYGVTFEWWEVDPRTNRDIRLIGTVEEGEITEDADAKTIATASVSIGELFPSESWLRCYLIAEQPPSSGNREKVPLGLFLAQTPSVRVDGKSVERPLELASPLAELDGDYPPVGYTVRRGADAIAAARFCFSRFHVRLADTTATATMPKDVTASDSDTWLDMGKAVLAEAGMEYSVDADGLVSFGPKRDASAMSAVWRFADDDISILLPEAEMDLDWMNVPNRVEVIVGEAAGGFSVSVENDDPSSPVSTATRGRTLTHRENNPEGVTTREQARTWAIRKLRELSCRERRITFRHGYCPVRVGDCVRIAYRRHQLDCKAKVVRRVIRCATDFEVESTAVYSEVLWNG